MVLDALPDEITKEVDADGEDQAQIKRLERRISKNIWEAEPRRLEDEVDTECR